MSRTRAFRDGVFSQSWPLVRYEGSVNSIADGSLGTAPPWWPQRAPYPYPPTDPYVQMFERGAVGSSTRAFRDGMFSQSWPLVRFEGSVNSIADGSLGSARRRLGLQGLSAEQKKTLGYGLAVAVAIGVYAMREYWS